MRTQRPRLRAHSHTRLALLALVAVLVSIDLRSAPVAFSAPAGLVAAYSFDEGTGTTIKDASGNGNNGTSANTSWVTGHTSKALSFNGSSSRVTVPDSTSLHLTAAMTLEAWVRRSGSI